MPHAPIIIAIAATLGTCVFALVCGGLAERIVAIIIGAGVPLGFATEMLSAQLRPIAELAGDGVIAFIVLALALRFATRWLGLALLLYAGQFSLHAFYFVTSRPLDPLYDTADDLFLFAITLCLLVGTIGTVRSRSATPAAAI